MAAQDTPSWLQEDSGNSASPAAGSYAANDGVTPAASMNGGANAAPPPSGISTATPATVNSSVTANDPDLPGVILTMRLTNMGASIALIVCAVVHMLSMPKISGWVLAVYACMGGVLICCLETQLKFLRVMIALNFGFLFDSVFRFFFYCLLGSVAFTFGFPLGVIVGGVIIGVAFFNTYVLCRYPSYRLMREEIAREEDKRIEARISKEVKRQAVRQMAS